MKKFFKLFSMIICVFCSLVFTSCSGKQMSYEEFHDKAFDIETNGPIYTGGHFYINIDTGDELFTYESDFTISAYGTVTFSKRINNPKWEPSIRITITLRASTIANEEGREYYYSKKGFVVKDIYKGEVSYQYEFDEYGYLTKAYDPSMGDKYIRTIEWH